MEGISSRSPREKKKTKQNTFHAQKIFGHLVKPNFVNLHWHARLLCHLYYFWRVFCDSNGTEGVPQLLVIAARCLVYPGRTVG